MADTGVIPPGFEPVTPQQSVIPPGFEPVAKTEELKPYEGSWRDKIARWMLSVGREEYDTPESKALNEKFVQGLVGSRGYGTTNPSVADLTPAGIVFAGQETQKAFKEHDYLTGAISALGVIPVVGAPAAAAARYIPRATRFAATEGGRETAAAGRVAAAAQKDFAERVGNDPATGQPMMRPEQVSPQMLEDVRARTRRTGTRQQTAAMRTVDYGGAETGAELRAAVNLSGQARQATRDVIPERFARQTERVLQWFEGRYGNAQASLQRLEAQREAARQPISNEYRRAYADGDRDIITPTLINMLNNPQIAGMFREGEQRLALQEAATNQVYRSRANTAPTLALWDQVKRVMDGQIGTMRRGGDLAGARHWTVIKNAMVQELDNEVPSYAGARGVAADAFNAATAFQAGQEVAKGTWPRGEIQSITQRMNPAERAEFQQGFLYDFLNDTVKKVGDTQSINAHLQRNMADREKVQEVLGPRAAGEFTAVLSVEGTIDHARQALGNSTSIMQGADVQKRLPGMTLPTLMGSGAAGIGLLAHGTDLKTAVAGLVTGALVRYGQIKNQQIAEDIATRVARKLLSNDPFVYRQGLKEVIDSEPLRNAFQYTASVLGRGASESAVPYTADQPDRGLFGRAGSPMDVSTPAEAANLPPGTWVRTPDGRVGQVKTRPPSAR